jgi:hypothetical protein
MRRADGSEFKNQGDCVSYVNTVSSSQDATRRAGLLARSRPS